MTYVLTYARTLAAAVKCKMMQDVAVTNRMVRLHPFLMADVMACVRYDAVGRNHIDAYPEIPAGVPVGTEQQQLHIKSALTMGSLLTAAVIGHAPQQQALLCVNVRR
jgi:hypothetical protein